MAKRVVVKAAKKRTKKKSVKKIAKKSVKKAATVKKIVSKPVAKKEKIEVYALGEDAPGERYFILANGQPVKHVAHLADVLDDLEDHVFDHHVNPERNDFHNWVKEVFKDVALAKKMLGVSNKKDLQLVIYKHAAHKGFRR